MALTPLPTPPSRNDPANFAERGDAFMSALPTLVTELSALQDDVTTKQGTASSAATTATNAAAAAETHKNSASGSAASAGNSATTAGTAAMAAESSSTTAQNWATKIDAEVVAGQGYGAKKYAQDAAASAASIDPSTLVRKTGNETIAGTKTFSSTPVVPVDFAWHAKPVGEIFFIRDDLAGVSSPPTDNANYRYIKLTASDAYNTGVLTSESVTGSAPLVVATAVISLAGSPINGKTVNLINTERRFVRAGASGDVQNDSVQNISGYIDIRRLGGGESQIEAASGALSLSTGAGASSARDNSSLGASLLSDRVTFSASSSSGARTDNETRARNIGATAYMRIK